MIWITISLTPFFLSIFLYLLNLVCKKKKNKNIREFLKDWLKFRGKRPKLKKFIAISFLLGTFGVSVLISYNFANRVAFFRVTSGYSEWRESNGQMYLYIEANSDYDLGYLAGYGLAYRIAGLKYLLFGLGITLGKNYFDALHLASQYLEFIPENMQEELLGLSEGASAGSGFLITFEDILLQALFFEVMYGRHFLTSEGQGCTAFGANNSGDTITIGQTIDLYQIQIYFSSFIHFKLGTNPGIFEFRLGACASAPIGKNDQGLMIIVNLVQVKQNAPICSPIFTLVREGLLNEQTPNGFYNTLFASNKSSYGMNLIIANSTDMIAVQSLPDNQTKSTPSSIAQSNTYIDPYWQQYLEDPEYSKERQQYAESILASNYSDSIVTASEMIAMLGDAPMICRDGGSLLSSGTIAFITSTSFGIGTPNGNVGTIPI